MRKLERTELVEIVKHWVRNLGYSESEIEKMVREGIRRVASDTGLLALSWDTYDGIVGLGQTDTDELVLQATKVALLEEMSLESLAMAFSLTTPAGRVEADRRARLIQDALVEARNEYRKALHKWRVRHGNCMPMRAEDRPTLHDGIEVEKPEGFAFLREI